MYTDQIPNHSLYERCVAGGCGWWLWSVSNGYDTSIAKNTKPNKTMIANKNKIKMSEAIHITAARIIASSTHHV